MLSFVEWLSGGKAFISLDRERDIMNFIMVDFRLSCCCIISIVDFTVTISLPWIVS